MAFAKQALAWLATGLVGALAGCTGVSVGQGASALSGGLFNMFAEAAIVVGRGAADVGNAVLDTVPFPAPTQASVQTPPPSVPPPPTK
jgi:hypothetical protein